MSTDNQVLISEYTYEKVKDRIEATFAGSKVFKGKVKEVRVYEIVSIPGSGEISKSGSVANSLASASHPSVKALEDQEHAETEPKPDATQTSAPNASL